MIPAKISEIKYCLQCQVMCSNLPHFVYKILQAQMQPLTIQIAFCLYLKMLYNCYQSIFIIFEKKHEKISSSSLEFAVSDYKEVGPG